MNYNIKTYPEDNSGLLAWNAADEYLINLFNEIKIENPSVLVINDSNGFLSININNFNPIVYTDSFTSNNSIQHNCIENNFKKNIVIIKDLNEIKNLNKLFDIVLLKIPKSIKRFNEIIHSIKPFLKENAKLISAGMTKHISSNTRDILSKSFGYTDITKVFKKSIAFISNYEILDQDKTYSTFTNFYDTEFDLNIFTLPNVFSSNKLDIGSRLLLENIKEMDIKGEVIDLGCGAGTIGLYCKKNNLSCRLKMVDESYQAILSSQKTFAENNFDAEFIWSDGINNIDEESIDYVISNPPFHSETTVNMNIGLILFKQVWKVLKKKGVFRLVFNKNLSYEPHLNKLFNSVKKVSENKKFVVYNCIK